ncbi:Os01g0300850 [Oryza sativa Japonica Group]|nr:Os01g0300850 [Oryza sativa Japonica Group]
MRDNAIHPLRAHFSHRPIWIYLLLVWRERRRGSDDSSHYVAVAFLCRPWRALAGSPPLQWSSLLGLEMETERWKRMGRVRG